MKTNYIPCSESASCPNLGECWDRGTATFMILGNICTRGCRFCDVPKGMPDEYDKDEPRRIAESIFKMKLKYAVIYFRESRRFKKIKVLLCGRKLLNKLEQ